MMWEKGELRESCPYVGVGSVHRGRPLPLAWKVYSLQDGRWEADMGRSECKRVLGAGNLCEFSFDGLFFQ